MAAIIYNLELTAKKFNLTRDAIVDMLVSIGYDRESIPLNGRISEEMMNAIQTNLNGIATGHLEEPKMLGRINLEGRNDSQARALIKEARKTRMNRLNLLNLKLRQLPLSILELKDHVTEILLGSPAVFANTGPNSEISNLNILKHFPHLKKLVLRSIAIGSVYQIPMIPELEILELSNCGLASLNGIEQFSNLNTLNLNRNFLENLDKLSQVKGLTGLQLSRNRIESLSFFKKGECQRLKSLKLSYNGNYSDQLHHLLCLEKLESLDLSGSNLIGIKQLANLKSLRELYLRKNRIIRINPLSRLISLEKLDLGENEIGDCAPISKLNRLTLLRLSGNQITDLNPLSRLGSITNLQLENNQISDISPLADMGQLKFLNLSSNQIFDLYPLRNLLKKSKYSFKVLLDQKAIFGLNPVGLLVSNNPIVNPPKQYLSAGLQAMLSYWDQQEKKSAEVQIKQVVNEAKLIIVGNSNVGKSTLSYLLRNRKLPSASLSSTHGLAFSTWKPDWRIDSKQLSINIIDFGGQEYYHDTHHLFFNEKAAYLLLWDPETNINKKLNTPIIDRQDFGLVRHFPIEYWLNAIEIYASGKSAILREEQKTAPDLNGSFKEIEDVIQAADEDADSMSFARYSSVGEPQLPPVLLVQTHVDTRGRRFLNLKDLQEKYDKLHGAISISMDIQTAKSEGIDLLELSIRDLYNSLSESVGQEYLGSWIAIRKHIEQREKGKYYIFTTAQFKEYFRTHSDSKEKYSLENIRTLCITLDYWGVVLYRYDKEELRDIIVVNPQFFIQRVNALLTEKIRQRNGVITRQEVIETLEMRTDKAEAFVRILTTFKVLFELPRKDIEDIPLYISPMFLAEKPGHVGLFISNFTAYYKIKYEGYFHKGMLLDCFKELGKDIYFEQGFFFYWQWGMVLKNRERILCIEFDEENLNQILIKTIRKDKENLANDLFLEEVLHTFQLINRQYRYELELSADGVDFVQKDRLLNELERGNNKFEWHGRNFDVRTFYFLLRPEEFAVPHKRVFVSYSSKDRNYLDKLAAHLQLYKKAGIATFWDDLMLHNREEWDEQIKEEMNKANILIMLLSPDYLATDYILQEEIPLALGHLEQTQASKRVFWVLLRPCSYDVFPAIARYPIFPLKEKDILTSVTRQKAISEHEDQDREWVKLLSFIFSETE